MSPALAGRLFTTVPYKKPILPMLHAKYLLSQWSPFPSHTAQAQVALTSELMQLLPRQYMGLPWWLSGKEHACQCRRHESYGFDP